MPERELRWPWLSLIPLGFGAWTPIYAGLRTRTHAWIALGVVWTAIAAAGWIDSAADTRNAGHNDLAGMLMVVGWAGGAATAFSIRREYERRIASPLLAAAEEASQRLADRARARELVHSNPALAAEVGIGRPDRPGAADAGLVDVNNASLKALLELPGVDLDVAQQIIELRTGGAGFSSVEDLGAGLDLPGDVVEGLRDRTVFLPRM
jgi:DNA uptake protein ComE-like DNA-binding protein